MSGDLWSGGELELAESLFLNMCSGPEIARRLAIEFPRDPPRTTWSVYSMIQEKGWHRPASMQKRRRGRSKHLARRVQNGATPRLLFGGRVTFDGSPQQEPRGCRYIAGDPREPGWGFCQGPLEPGKPYCAVHMAKCVDIESTLAGLALARERSARWEQEAERVNKPRFTAQTVQP